jgi:hypothetical protein
MTFAEEVAALAAKHKLGQVSSHIFNIWEVPLQPFTTTQLIAFAQEIHNNAFEEGYAVGLLHGVRAPQEE